MGFRVNPDRWLPIKDYLRYLWHFATTHAEDNPYNTGVNHKTQFQRRLAKIMYFDGPIHTLVVWHARIRYNWFTIGWKCWRNGHSFKDQNVTTAPQRKLHVIEPGRVEFRKTGKQELHYVSVCTRCGKFNGRGTREV